MIKHKNVELHIKFTARNLMKITWSPSILTTKYTQELPIIFVEQTATSSTTVVV